MSNSFNGEEERDDSSGGGWASVVTLCGGTGWSLGGESASSGSNGW